VERRQAVATTTVHVRAAIKQQTDQREHCIFAVARVRNVRSRYRAAERVDLQEAVPSDCVRVFAMSEQ
jgi:hypothetical protein